jgi:hypothetical protein
MGQVSEYTWPFALGVNMRTIYARTESALPLSPGEHVVGVVERPGTLTEYCVDGECPPAVSLAQLRRALPLSLLTALASPARPRKSDHDAWMWQPPGHVWKPRARLTHAGRERKRGRL